MMKTTTAVTAVTDLIRYLIPYTPYKDISYTGLYRPVKTVFLISLYSCNS